MKQSQETQSRTRTDQAVISAKGAARIRDGHLWIYRSDVTQRPKVESGTAVRVADNRGRFLAWAHFGAESEITLRLLSKNETAIDREFWRARLLAAAAWRRLVVDDTDAYRLVHAEGDLLPGLIIDRYGDCFTLQTLTRGMDSLKPLWVELLVELFQPRLIVERNDAKVRQLEGLPLLNSVLYSRDDEINASEFAITENGIKFWVDLLEGQKTGAFLDQRENRAAAMTYAGGRGLDCFSFHGSFALHLASDCDEVTAIDISEAAIERARRNAELNGINNIEFIAGNVFDKLRDYDDAGERFDTIVLDPPAFAKNRGAVEGALRGYKEINLRALRILKPGGVLITCSCSYHILEPLFMEMLAEAALDAGRQVQVIEKRTQGRDHPILLTVPETYYLKCVVLRVME
ncbi:MAG TPA: class I SAM-dependent rRNA methyltransferase [Blastocatellia bacterium]|nr:class I SAM-dependent rRNA methyltransferase [Blastocatellia bacterium]HMX27446.1 class I SAM-dependent rRNA methyltransferase [Blastocatellia bacterium]HMY73302.1 class I SAM-dependent rRNA methyltransferase [Blastocatellia bacterium]HNG30404.1 class I SAM-dependent rRNA methyltransferase [Blastocatellia bacterium]